MPPPSLYSRTTWENERNLFSLESTRHANIMEFVTSESNESGGMVATSPLQLYLVTRYYPLGTLEGYLRANVLSWKQACCVVWSIANGLKHLHSESCTECAGIKTEKYAIAHRWVWWVNFTRTSPSSQTHWFPLLRCL